MKNIKFYSALALSIVVVSAFSTVASAEDTKSSVELSPDTGNGASKVLPTDPLDLSKDLLDSIYATGKKPDVTDPALAVNTAVKTNADYPNEVIPGYAGDLHFSLIPKEFNFGSHKVNAANQHTGMTYKQESAAPFSGKQAVEVHDGRITDNDWHVEAELGALSTIKGASITFKNTQINTEYTGGKLKLGKGHTVVGATNSFTLTESGSSVSFLSAEKQSKGNNAAYWNAVDDVEITIPAGAMTIGKHSAAVTWTLVNAAE